MHVVQNCALDAGNCANIYNIYSSIQTRHLYTENIDCLILVRISFSAAQHPAERKLRPRPHVCGNLHKHSHNVLRLNKKMCLFFGGACPFSLTSSFVFVCATLSSEAAAGK